MKKEEAYSTVIHSGRMHVSSIKFFIIFICFFTFLPGITSFAQEEIAYDEISVFLDVPDVGSGER